MDQIQLQQLNEVISAAPEILFNRLSLPFDTNYDRIQHSCIIHNGDSRTALSISLRQGFWKCYTRQCHAVFHSSLIGFTRGILSNTELNWRQKGDATFSFSRTCSFLTNLYNFDNSKTNSVEQVDRYKFFSQIASQKQKETTAICSVEDYLANTKPSEYFLKRGFSPETLEVFNVRSSIRRNRFFSGRSLVPIFDVENRNVLGISARAETEGVEPKWLHSKGYPSGSTFYGLGQATPVINKVKTAIIVEGPADVWRLHEAGIYNVLGLNGLALTPAKHHILDKLGVMNIVLCLDNDEGGKNGRETISKTAARLYNIYEVCLPNGKNDIGELSIKEVKGIFH